MMDIFDRKNAGLMTIILLVAAAVCGLIQYILIMFVHQDFGILASGFLVCLALSICFMLWAAGIFRVIWEFIKRYVPILATVALGLLLYQWFMRDLTAKNIAVWGFIGAFLECFRHLGLYLNKRDRAKKSARQT